MYNHILNNLPKTESQSILPMARLIERFARALHRYGLPSHRIEESLQHVSRRLDIHGQFFATPTAIFCSLERDGQEKTILIRVDPGEVNLEKLSRLSEVLDDFTNGALTPEATEQEIDAINAAKPSYGSGLVTFGFMICSACASRFFGGGWREFVVCGVIGLLAGAVAVNSHRINLRLFEPLAAFLAGFVAVAASSLLPPISVYVAMCAGLIVLIPGLTLTIGISELATRNLAAGTVRLVGALALFLQIGFGVAVGMKAGEMIFGAHVAGVSPQALPGWTLLAALLIASIGFTILFQARARDAGWIVLVSALAFAGARLGGQSFGTEVGAFVGAMVVGVASNIFARALKRPASLTLVPGIMLLVPGSLGFKSLSSLIENDILSGMEMAFTMGMTGVAIVAGLLFANVLIPSHKAL
jgi:uncharacterized membrane protein YjjP (DUF1212 family)